MQDPIELLMSEHRVIEHGLHVLKQLGQSIKIGPYPEEIRHLAQCIVFIEEFADKAHHGKEEDILFQIMVEYGFPKDTGPIAVMLAEHEQGRSLVASLKKYTEASTKWSDQDRLDIGSIIVQFYDLLSQHIQKEDNVLYPMAKQRLDELVWDQIAEKCQEFDSTFEGNVQRENADQFLDQIKIPIKT